MLFIAALDYVVELYITNRNLVNAQWSDKLYSAVAAVYSRHSSPEHLNRGRLVPTSFCIASTVSSDYEFISGSTGTNHNLSFLRLDGGGRGIWDWRGKSERRAGTWNDSGLPSTPLTIRIGLEAVTVRIRAYRATGEVDNASKYYAKVAITQGTKLLLTCHVTGFPEDSDIVSYRWFHSLTGYSQERYEIGSGYPYYRHSLVDVTSLDQGGRYTCFVSFSNAPQSSGSTAILTVEG